MTSKSRTPKYWVPANEVSRLSKPLQSRFRRLFLPRYIEEQFLDVAVKVCPKLNETTAHIIGEEVWEKKGDIRDVISISILVRKNDGEEEIKEIMATMDRYGKVNKDEL